MPPPKIGKPAFRKGAASSNPDRIKDKNDTSKRDKSTINRLNMYKSGKPIRDTKGKILGGDFMSRDKAGNEEITTVTGRVAPDRRWFGNTRVVGAAELDSFRDAMAARMHDPYAVVLNARSLPMGLLTDSKATARANLLTAESFSGTFGSKAQRKRVKLSGAVGDITSLVASASEASAEYHADGHVDRDRVDGEGGDKAAVRASVFDKGQSRRIWGELYKVLDSSDVVLQILDARDPMGTRSPVVEKFLKEHARHKHLVFILNKCDLVPTWVTRRWVAALSAEAPTLAFHASLTKPFGKGALIALLRQFSKLHADKKAISVGFIGYPNTGKSSIINALSAKKVCSVAPIPGETKVWQYVTLMKRVFLVDSPGVVPPNAGEAEAAIVLKGVVRATKLDAPEEYIPDLVARVKPAHLAALYHVPAPLSVDPEDCNVFLTALAVKQGRMLKGGEPDVSTVARNVLFDWQRGRLPYFTPPPDSGPSATPGGAAAVASAAAAAAAAALAGGASSSSSSAAPAPVVPITGGLPAGIKMEPQVIPRLGAHALLEEEEEEADRGQVPATRPERGQAGKGAGGDDIGEDGVYDSEDDEAAAEAAAKAEAVAARRAPPKEGGLSAADMPKTGHLKKRPAKEAGSKQGGKQGEGAAAAAAAGAGASKKRRRDADAEAEGGVEGAAEGSSSSASASSSAAAAVPAPAPRKKGKKGGDAPAAAAATGVAPAAPGGKKKAAKAASSAAASGAVPAGDGFDDLAF